MYKRQTIHNIAYQGKYGTDILEDTCGIGHRDQHIVEYDGCANFMKGAFETADKITTCLLYTSRCV